MEVGEKGIDQSMTRGKYLNCLMGLLGVLREGVWCWVLVLGFMFVRFIVAVRYNPVIFMDKDSLLQENRREPDQIR